MTPEDVIARVQAIKVRDSEVAHGQEDDLHRDVLQWVADNCTDHNCSILARQALKTCELDFSRWCA
jgi:hypothetical protein